MSFNRQVIALIEEEEEEGGCRIRGRERGWAVVEWRKGGREGLAVSVRA